MDQKEQQELEQLLDAQYPVDADVVIDEKTWWKAAEEKGYTPLAFTSSFDLMAWADENIQNGITVLHPWQVETNEFLSNAENPLKYTQDMPLHFNLVAVNGSGKDAYVIAPWAVFFAACKVRSRCVITSSSFKQLNTQTEAYIRFRCERINKKLGYKFFIIKRQHIYCPATGSEIVLFVTDEEGNVEGYHPWPDYPGAEMCIITNESKSISENTFNALRRCTGYNYWIEVSSPGKKEGHFYNACTSERTVYYPNPPRVAEGYRYARRVTAYDCLHISKHVIELARIELEDWLFRSIYLAEFTSETELVVLTKEKLEACKDVRYNGDVIDLAGGLDLSLGGDETVLATRRGNKITYLDIWRISDSNVLESEIDAKLKDRGYVKGETPIYTDVGGLGKPIYYHLTALGWNVIAVLNNRAATTKHLYANGGTEDWFNFKNLVVRKAVVLPRDSTLEEQLCSRHYNYKDNNKITLEPKKEAKAQGRPSPDRADAVVLSCTGFNPPELKDVANYRMAVKAGKPISFNRITQQDLVEITDESKFGVFQQQLADMNREKREASKMHGQEAWIDLALKEYNKQILDKQ